MIYGIVATVLIMGVLFSVILTADKRREKMRNRYRDGDIGALITAKASAKGELAGVVVFIIGGPAIPAFLSTLIDDEFVSLVVALTGVGIVVLGFVTGHIIWDKFVVLSGEIGRRRQNTKP